MGGGHPGPPPRIIQVSLRPPFGRATPQPEVVGAGGVEGLVPTAHGASKCSPPPAATAAPSSAAPSLAPPASPRPPRAAPFSQLRRGVDPQVWGVSGVPSAPLLAGGGAGGGELRFGHYGHLGGGGWGPPHCELRNPCLGDPCILKPILGPPLSPYWDPHPHIGPPYPHIGTPKPILGPPPPYCDPHPHIGPPYPQF